MLTTVRRSRPKGPLRAIPGATNNRKIGGRLCYCDSQPSASHYPLPSFARTAFTTTLLHATEHPVAIPSACSVLIFFPVPARLLPLPSLGCHHSLSTAAYADVAK